jgi:hypothetical protein
MTIQMSTDLKEVDSEVIEDAVEAEVEEEEAEVTVLLFLLVRDQ